MSHAQLTSTEPWTSFHTCGQLPSSMTGACHLQTPCPISGVQKKNLRHWAWDSLFYQAPQATHAQETLRIILRKHPLLIHKLLQGELLSKWKIGFKGPWKRKGASLVAQMVKNLPAMQDAWVRPLGWEDPLEKGITTHSSILAWRIPWTEEPGGL